MSGDQSDAKPKDVAAAKKVVDNLQSEVTKQLAAADKAYTDAQAAKAAVDAATASVKASNADIETEGGSKADEAALDALKKEAAARETEAKIENDKAKAAKAAYDSAKAVTDGSPALPAAQAAAADAEKAKADLDAAAKEAGTAKDLLESTQKQIEATRKVAEDALRDQKTAVAASKAYDDGSGTGKKHDYEAAKTAHAKAEADHQKALAAHPVIDAAALGRKTTAEQAAYRAARTRIADLAKKAEEARKASDEARVQAELARNHMDAAATAAAASKAAIETLADKPVTGASGGGDSSFGGDDADFSDGSAIDYSGRDSAAREGTDGASYDYGDKPFHVDSQYGPHAYERDLRDKVRTDIRAEVDAYQERRRDYERASRELRALSASIHKADERSPADFTKRGARMDELLGAVKDLEDPKKGAAAETTLKAATNNDANAQKALIATLHRYAEAQSNVVTLGAALSRDRQMNALHAASQTRLRYQDWEVRAGKHSASSAMRAVSGAVREALEGSMFKFYQSGDRFVPTGQMAQDQISRYMLGDTRSGAGEYHYAAAGQVEASLSAQLETLFVRLFNDAPNKALRDVAALRDQIVHDFRSLAELPPLMAKGEDAATYKHKHYATLNTASNNIVRTVELTYPGKDEASRHLRIQAAIKLTTTYMEMVALRDLQREMDMLPDGGTIDVDAFMEKVRKTHDTCAKAMTFRHGGGKKYIMQAVRKQVERFATLRRFLSTTAATDINLAATAISMLDALSAERALQAEVKRQGGDPAKVTFSADQLAQWKDAPSAKLYQDRENLATEIEDIKTKLANISAAAGQTDQQGRPIKADSARLEQPLRDQLVQAQGRVAEIDHELSSGRTAKREKMLRVALVKDFLYSGTEHAQMKTAGEQLIAALPPRNGKTYNETIRAINELERRAATIAGLNNKQKKELAALKEDRAAILNSPHGRALIASGLFQGGTVSAESVLFAVRDYMEQHPVPAGDKTWEDFSDIMRSLPLDPDDAALDRAEKEAREAAIACTNPDAAIQKKAEVLAQQYKTEAAAAKAALDQAVEVLNKPPHGGGADSVQMAAVKALNTWTGTTDYNTSDFNDAATNSTKATALAAKLTGHVQDIKKITAAGSPARKELTDLEIKAASAKKAEVAAIAAANKANAALEKANTLTTLKALLETRPALERTHYEAKGDDVAPAKDALSEHDVQIQKYAQAAGKALGGKSEDAAKQEAQDHDWTSKSAAARAAQAEKAKELSAAKAASRAAAQAVSTHKDDIKQAEAAEPACAAAIKALDAVIDAHVKHDDTSMKADPDSSAVQREARLAVEKDLLEKRGKFAHAVREAADKDPLAKRLMDLGKAATRVEAAGKVMSAMESIMAKTGEHEHYRYCKAAGGAQAVGGKLTVPRVTYLDRSKSDRASQVRVQMADKLAAANTAMANFKEALRQVEKFSSAPTPESMHYANLAQSELVQAQAQLVDAVNAIRAIQNDPANKDALRACTETVIEDLKGLNAVADKLAEDNSNVTKLEAAGEIVMATPQTETEKAAARKAEQAARADKDSGVDFNLLVQSQRYLGKGKQSTTYQNTATRKGGATTPGHMMPGLDGLDPPMDTATLMEAVFDVKDSLASVEAMMAERRAQHFAGQKAGRIPKHEQAPPASIIRVSTGADGRKKVQIFDQNAGRQRGVMDPDMTDVGRRIAERAKALHAQRYQQGPLADAGFAAGESARRSAEVSAGKRDALMPATSASAPSRPSMGAGG